MRGYINTLIITMIVSQLSILLSPNRSYAKQYIKFLCCLSVALCLISPVKDIIVNGKEYITEIKEIFSVEDDMIISDTRYSSVAAFLIDYIADNYDINEDNIRIICITNEDDTELMQIQIYLKNTDRVKGSKVEEFLQKELLIPTYIFVEE